MRAARNACLLVVALIATTAGAETRPITVGELQKRGVSGRLGPALGTIVTVEGRVVPNRSRRKADADVSSVLRIVKVNGEKLKRPVIYRFKRAHDWAKLPAPKVGVRFRYVGYETGAFVGSPKGEFKHVLAYTTTGFHFETVFLVLVPKN